MADYYQVQGEQACQAKRRGPAFLLGFGLGALVSLGLALGIGLAVAPGFFQKPQVESKQNQIAQVYQLDRLTLSLEEGSEAEHRSLAKLEQIYEALKANFYLDLSLEEYLERLATALPSAMGNRYTYWMSAEDFRSLQESSAGEYYGIGATVRKLENGAYEITEVREGSPAEKAGILASDVIVAVNDKPVTDFVTIESLVGEVKGPEGTEVKLGLERSGQKIERVVTRGAVKVIEVHHRLLDGNIGYIQMVEFSVTLPDFVESAIQELKARGATKFIFDMRYNPGGDAAALLKITNMLMPKGTVATLEGRSDGEAITETWSSQDGTLLPVTTPYVILVNQHTASAAELFSGSMRDRMGAYLIGEQTFGKGSGTITVPLLDGSAVNVTVFTYKLPSGEFIEEVGLKPDLVMVDQPNPTKPIWEREPSEDPLLAAAVKQLEKR